MQTTCNNNFCTDGCNGCRANQTTTFDYKSLTDEEMETGIRRVSQMAEDAELIGHTYGLSHIAAIFIKGGPAALDAFAKELYPPWKAPRPYKMNEKQIENYRVVFRARVRVMAKEITTRRPLYTIDEVVAICLTAFETNPSIAIQVLGDKFGLVIGWRYDTEHHALVRN